MSPTVRLSNEAYALLEDMSQRGAKPVSAILERAIADLHRNRIGEPGCRLEIPFKKVWSDNDAEVLLRQARPTEFSLEESFRYKALGIDQVCVKIGNKTDLASVPGPLLWLVPRYGRHTLPALLHDQLVKSARTSAERERADEILRDSMGAMRVPFVRRWIMWAAVITATLWKSSWFWRLLIGVWIFTFAIVGVDLVARLAGLSLFPAVSGVPVPIEILSPLALAGLWGKRYQAGLALGYALFVLPVPIAAVVVALIVNAAAEGVAKASLHVFRFFGRDLVVNPIRVRKAFPSVRR